MLASISTPPDFSFPATVESHGWYHLAPFRWSPKEGLLRRAERLAGRAVELEIGLEKGELAVNRKLTPELRTKLTRMLQLDVDIAEFVELTRASPAHEWVARYGFGRLLCGATLFEDVVKIIATTNTMWSQTVRMVDLLVTKCGSRTKEGHAAFPEPAEVARFTAEELQRDCRLGYRAKSIHALATRGLDLEAMSDAALTTTELFRQYQTLPGIGPYGAAHLLAMSGRHDFVAVDTEFRRFVRERYHGGRKVSDATMLRRYSKWGRWRYLVYWSELWSSVRPVAREVQESTPIPPGPKY